MINQRTKNRFVVLGIVGLAVAPFLLAWVLLKESLFSRQQTNKGALINPPVQIDYKEFIGLDSFSSHNIAELRGHWILLNIVPNPNCNNVCREAIHKTRQIRLMLNKDLTRTRRVVLFIAEVNAETVNQWLQDDKVLLKVKPGTALAASIAKVAKGAIPEGMLLLMDPLGNLMMQYEPGFDPYKVKSDLMHLLRISQIG